MTRILLMSGRDRFRALADACAFDFEDAIIDATQCDVLTATGTRSGLAPGYDLAIMVAISLNQLFELDREIRRQGAMPPAQRRIAYVFGGYGAIAGRYRNPARRYLSGAARCLAGLDRLYVGIADDVGVIESSLDVPTRYLPMAANCVTAAARPFASWQDRPIAVTGFGRQHRPTAAALSDRLNRPESPELFYNTNFTGLGSTVDRLRYRAMFWQILRKSRISLAFDHFFTDPGRAKLSYVGPRWFEILAAGAVLAGRAPATADRARLLDWPDAAIDLPQDPEAAVDTLMTLLADEDRMRAISLRNLQEMHARHDWRHRLAEMLRQEGMSAGPDLGRALDRLAEVSGKLAA